MNGEYTERLPHFNQGNLVVRKHSWWIRFYFPGPDLRYNGTFFSIYSSEVDAYIQAYILNWEKYKKMTNKVSGSFETTGAMKMKIRVGGYWPGVSLTSYHLPLNSEIQINNMINDLKWAKERAKIISENIYRES